QIRQVLTNLVSNSAESIGPAGGLIRLAVGSRHCTRAMLEQCWLGEDRPEGVYATLEVSDNGCGMDEATMGRAFEPFFSTKFTGRGLGLAAVLGIVRSHRGALLCRSRAGQGTTVRLFFPARPDVTARAEARSDGPPVAGLHRGATVLVVDDEEGVSELARRHLLAAGLQVLCASGGRQAVTLLESRTEPVDLVLLDLVMPGLDGRATYQELRRIRPDLPVLLTSGFGEEQVSEYFENGQLAGFLRKPYRREQLLDAVRKVLDAGPQAPA
ncbi:MAG: response regulator, partial [Candidatus Riflebacteria bacterium]|nr:response regulator [Candidatus Riflebacteria bacterium]